MQCDLVASVAQPKDSFLKFQYRRLATGLGWSVFGLGGLFLSCTWFPLLNLAVKDKEIRALKARATISAAFRFFFKFLTFIGVMTYEVDNLKETQNLQGTIIVANHPTILDYVIVVSQMPSVNCIVKAELKQNFFLKGVVKAADYVVNDCAEKVIDICQKRLDQGENILIFPEGTRSKPGQPIKLRRGVAHIALRCKCPIQVLGITCSDRWLDKASKWYEIPKSKPKITLKKKEFVKVEPFLRESERMYSLAARRLTRYLTDLLSNTA